MAIAPPHTCRCGRIVRGRCGVCQRRRAAARPSSVQRGYDAAWATYSRRWLQRYPWCGQRQDGLRHAEHSRCTVEGQQVRAQCTDHIRAMAAGGAKFDPANHQSLCLSCNARKAVALEGGFGHDPQRKARR